MKKTSTKVAGKKVAGRKKAAKPGVIASRRSCSAKGTGLSHYVLMEEKAK